MSETPAYTFLPWDALVPIPATVVVCPWCQAPLHVDVEEWQDDPDGTTRATMLSWICSTEPDLDDPAWQAWNLPHRIPLSYEEGLDIDEALLDWLTAHVRFVEAAP